MIALILVSIILSLFLVIWLILSIKQFYENKTIWRSEYEIYYPRLEAIRESFLEAAMVTGLTICAGIILISLIALFIWAGIRIFGL